MGNGLEKRMVKGKKEVDLHIIYALRLYVHMTS